MVPVVTTKEVWGTAGLCGVCVAYGPLPSAPGVWSLFRCYFRHMKRAQTTFSGLSGSRRGQFFFLKTGL
jgi:hypothetical protein